MAKVFIVERQKKRREVDLKIDPLRASLTGRELRTAAQIRDDETVFSMDLEGHVQTEDGPIELDDMLYVRDGREFFVDK